APRPRRRSGSAGRSRRGRRRRGASRRPSGPAARARPTRGTGRPSAASCRGAASAGPAGLRAPVGRSRSPLALDDRGGQAERPDEAERAGGEQRRAHDEVVVRLPQPAGALLHALEVRDDADDAVEEVQRRDGRQRGAGGLLGDDACEAGGGERRREHQRRPHPLVAERALVVLEVDLRAERGRRHRRGDGEQLLHPAFADVLEQLEDHAAHRCASARFNSSPWPARERSGTRAPPSGASTPSNSIDSMRVWSWKYSRCRRRSTPHRACAESWGAQWPEMSMPYAAASPFTRSRPVMPPQRVMSAWRQSTHPSRLRKSAGTYAYSPAATSSKLCSRTSRSPAKSADDTGSSNQRTFQFWTYSCAQRIASLAVNAPFASTYSSASPIASRAASSRFGSFSGSRP